MVIRRLPRADYKLIPKPREILYSLISLIPIVAATVPIGIATEFLTLPHAPKANVMEMILVFIGIFLTVALPEEMVFRVVIQNGLEDYFKPNHAWIIASIFFGLVHWNNAATVFSKVVYCTLATVAGFFYGYAYKETRNILAPALTHTLVDWIWRFFLA